MRKLGDLRLVAVVVKENVSMEGKHLKAVILGLFACFCAEILLTK